MLKKKKLSVAGVTILYMTLILTMAVALIPKPAKCDPSTSIIVAPMKSSIDINQTVVVNITVAEVSDLGSWQITLYFDPTILNCTGAEYPADHVFAGKSYIPVDPVVLRVNATHSYVLYGCCLLGEDTFTGNGTLCQIEFKGIEVGKSCLNFSRPYGEDTFLETPDGPIPDVELQDGISFGVCITVIPEFSSLLILPILLTLTLIAVAATKKAFGKSKAYGTKPNN